MTQVRFLLALGLSLFLAATSQASPFSATLVLEGDETAPAIRVTVKVPAGHHLYSDSIKLKAEPPITFTATLVPPAHDILDPILQEQVSVYECDTELTYGIQGWTSSVLSVSLSFRGCSETECFMDRETFDLSRDGGAVAGALVVPAPAAQGGGEGTAKIDDGFRMKGSASGYVDAAAFVDFLEKGDTTDSLRAIFDRWGIWMYLLAVLLGGLALNFTPCVLPMIPVNIAIIGAGAGGGSKQRGFALGGAYGLGIALVYGALGLVFVRSSQRFGTLNATPWFNFGIAALFVVMALAMFGLFQVDFSKYMTRVGPQPTQGNRGRFMVAFLMGGVSALLAGACVAPVVISVLLLATDLYSEGHRAAQFLPFAIGVGMALPWPFAGAGLSFLPKPGRWMERVKVGFGIIILLMAIYYLRLGVSLLKPTGADETVNHGPATAVHDGWYQSLEPALVEARRTQKDVFIDFWATWCKNCVKMNKTTFQDAAVVEKLKGTVNVAIQAEDLDDPAIKGLLDRYGVVGLPTYVMLELIPVDEGK